MILMQKMGLLLPFNRSDSRKANVPVGMFHFPIPDGMGEAIRVGDPTLFVISLVPAAQD